MKLSRRDFLSWIGVGAVAAPMLVRSAFALDGLITVSDISSTTVPAVVMSFMTSGFYAHGDEGGGIRVRITTPSLVKSYHAQSADGAWWKYAPDGRVNLRSCGANGLITQNATPFIQDANDLAAGKEVFASVGRYRMDSGVTNVGGMMNIVGENNGAGSGRYGMPSSGVTQFVANFTSGHLFSVVSEYSSKFRNFQISSLVTRTSGAAIFVSGTTTVANSSTKIVDVAFAAQYDCIWLQTPFMPEVTGCYFFAWVRAGIFANAEVVTPRVEGSGGWYHHNRFWGESELEPNPALNVIAQQLACVFLTIGYAQVTHNHILGAQYGVLIAVDTTNAGSTWVSYNIVENQRFVGVSVSSTDGSLLGPLSINGNKFSNLAYTTYFQASIVLNSRATQYLFDVDIHHNSHRHGLSGARFIWAMTGTKLRIESEKFENLGTGATTYGIDLLTGADVWLGALVLDVQLLGPFLVGFLHDARTDNRWPR